MKKFLVSIVVMIIMLCALATSVSALSFTPTITPSKKTVPEQQEFTVTVAVSNLDVGSNGINTLKGTLSYDSDVFEIVAESSVEGRNGWKVKYNESNKEIEALKGSFVKSSEEVFQITLKTKSGVTDKEGKISFSSITASNSETDISANDISTSIKIGVDTEPTQTPISINSILNNVNSTNSTNNTTNTIPLNNIFQNNTTNSITNNTINNRVANNTNSSINNVNNNNSASNKDIVYAGVEDGIVKVIFGVIIIAALAFWRYHSLKEIK